MNNLNYVLIKPVLVFCICFFVTIKSAAQDSPGNFIKDAKTGCTVWFKHIFSEDSVTWDGGCTNSMANGMGTMKGFTNGVNTSTYVGMMLNGKPHGEGAFSFNDQRKLSGNFSHGEPLFLNEKCLKLLNKHVMSTTDPIELYDGDNAAKELYYHAIIPEGNIKGALVLFPGTWETTEHVISSNRQLCELVVDNQMAVIVPSLNQRLTMNDTVLSLINSVLKHAVATYNIASDKLVFGGLSIGGLFSLRYTEMSFQFPEKTAIRPAAVFSVDGPCDLEFIYEKFTLKLRNFPNNGEAKYGIAEMKKYCGGSPQEAQSRYRYFSCYSHLDPEGGNAKYLLNIPVRIYCDVDPVWWMENRGLHMYYLNALDQTAMIQLLNDKGNEKAEFINAFQKGYRLEGNRHPHSWSIVDPAECVKWIKDAIR